MNDGRTVPASTKSAGPRESGTRADATGWQSTFVSHSARPRVGIMWVTFDRASTRTLHAATLERTATGDRPRRGACARLAFGGTAAPDRRGGSRMGERSRPDA